MVAYVNVVQMQTMAVSLAYMIYDLGCGLFEKQFKIDNSIHHLVSIIGFGAGLAYEKVRASISSRYQIMLQKVGI